MSRHRNVPVTLQIVLDLGEQTRWNLFLEMHIRSFKLILTNKKGNLKGEEHWTDLFHLVDLVLLYLLLFVRHDHRPSTLKTTNTVNIWSKAKDRQSTRSTVAYRQSRKEDYGNEQATVKRRETYTLIDWQIHFHILLDKKSHPKMFSCHNKPEQAHIYSCWVQANWIVEYSIVEGEEIH